MSDHKAAYDWNLIETEEHVRLALPEGWTVQFTGDNGLLDSALIDHLGVTLWRGSGTDRRVLLLGVYGWLLASKTEVRNPMWVRRLELTPTIAAADAAKIVRFRRD